MRSTNPQNELVVVSARGHEHGDLQVQEAVGDEGGVLSIYYINLPIYTHNSGRSVFFKYFFNIIFVFAHNAPVLMDSLMGMCEWVSDSRKSALLANPCKLRIRMTDVLCPHHVGSAYGMAIHTISSRLENHCRMRTNPLGLRMHANCECASQ